MNRTTPMPIVRESGNPSAAWALRTGAACMIFETLSASNIRTTRVLTMLPAQRAFDIGLRWVANGIGHLDTGLCPPAAPSASASQDEKNPARMGAIAFV